MYSKDIGVTATIAISGLVVTTNPQVGDMAGAMPWGIEIRRGNGTRELIPWQLVVEPVTTEFVDVFWKMDVETEEYFLCPPDELEAAKAYTEEQAKVDAESLAGLEALVADESGEPA